MSHRSPASSSLPDDSPLMVLVHALRRLVLVLGGALGALALAVFVAVPIAYDTLHLNDTMFFADLGWRVLHGLRPTLDFGHFYGGVVAQYVGLAFAFFGVSLKAIDYAFVMMLFSALVLAGVVGWRRISGRSFAVLCLLLFACLLTRVPLEHLTAVQRPTASHAFIYNRYAIALALPLSLFALLPAARREAEWAAALIGGAVAFMLVLIKPTFVTFPVALFLALALTRRWSALGLCVAGAVLGMLLLDPGAARVLASFEYAVASAAGNTTVGGMVLKCVAVFLVHPLAFFMLCLVAVLMWHRAQPGRAGLLGAAVVLAGGFAGMTATMGWLGDVGQQVLPLMAVLTLAFFEQARRAVRHSAHATMTECLALLAALAFSLPHLAQTVLSGAQGWRKAEMIQTTGTPLDSYLAWSDEFKDSQGNVMNAQTPWEDQVAAAAQVLQNDARANAGVHYVQLIDGVRLLQRLSDVADHGIAGDIGAFGFALGAAPVVGFPPWVNVSIPELAEDRPLPEEITVMMLRRQDNSKITTRLRAKVRDGFRPCMQSVLWTLYLRDGAARTECDL